MPWIRIDDHFDEHPKHAAVGPVGWGVWLAGLAYCNRNLTDGFIPWSVAEGMGGAWRLRATEDDEANNVVHQVVWTVARTSGMSGDDMTGEWIAGRLVEAGLWEHVRGGYQVHDYAAYQPSKADVLLERQKWADKKKSQRMSPVVSPVESPQDSQPSPTRPVPNPKPVPKGAPSKEVAPIAREALEVEEGADALVAYHSLTGRFPAGRVRSWLDDLTAKHGDEAVTRALARELTTDGAVNTLLSRTQSLLEREAHEAEKRRQAAAIKAAEEERQKLANVPPEVLAANKARVHQMMVEAGLVSSKQKEESAA